MKSKPLLFLDTSVLLSAVFSSRGGSSVILDFAQNSIVKIVITPKVIAEARKKLKQKHGSDELERLYDLLMILRSSIKHSPIAVELKPFNDLIVDPKDRHILAGAAKYKVDYLVTLDRKHFLTDRISNAGLPFRICIPQVFLEEFRQSK